ncbi:GAF domain-containing sensor histidine kinase [Streptomyces melanosporofaciens]|uniref:Histidine kinase-, DNA gyrase B-, and HSP90-like ATPase n=1 Tax=Streptomyces melanosporofaciens TaxID=67327 RepID=A0A1H4QSU3_STRMJ|nr:GAF domain-containing protein [Streptomyces melanosporofaciens]SEC22592.1 Histidine kinase-, DNA gyrase B-, and HSP90-like ATPase [Streptomyces melanosporofaciens]
MAAAAPSPDPLDVAAEATRGLRGLSTELTARLPRLLEAMRSLGDGPDAHTVLDRIVRTAAELVGARCAAIGVHHADGHAAGGQGLADVVTYGGTETDRERCAELPADALRTGTPSADRPPGSYLSLPLRVGEEVFGTLCLAGKRDGGPFTESDRHLVEVLATEAGIAIGHTRVQGATRQRERWIEGSVAVTQALLSGGAGEGPAVVAEKVRELADAVVGIVLLPEEGEGGLKVAAVAADERSGLLGTVLPARSPAVPRLLAGQPVVIEDPATDPLLGTGVPGRYGPSLMVPLSSGDRVVGVLATARERGASPFTATERTLAAQFAAQAAVALVLAEAQRDRERLAVLEERDRIARDLHDLVVQRLFATGMLLESAERQLDAPEVRERIERAVEELGATIQEVRTAIYALQQTPPETPPGLRGRVLREVRAAAVPLGFQPSLTFVGPVDSRVGTATGAHLVAALREALSNAFRHARAERIEVVVDATGRLADGRPSVRLTVADDGVGVPAGGRRSGLTNLVRRAEALGGSSGVGPGLGEGGRGTTVVWEAPLPSEGA